MKKKLTVTLVLSLVITTMVVVNGFSATDTKTADNTQQKVSFVDAEIVASGVNLREGTSLNHKIMGVLEKGTEVKILGKIDNWYAIYVPSKETVGVADSKYIKTAEEKTAGSNALSLSAKVAAASTDNKQEVTIDKDEEEVLNLLNAARKDAGLEPLLLDASLQKVADIKVKDMVTNQYFGHKSPTYGSPFDLMRRSGVAFKSAGENISGNKSGAAAANAWMANENHKANILNSNYKYVGIGVANDDKYGKLYVVEFIQK
jgi:uncharacterized YkwD family protein